MSSLLLYSTNVYLKLLIQQRYRNDLHWVWCSDSFDSTKQPGHTLASLVAPSSNPVDIYRELKQCFERTDLHNAKIQAQKASLKSLAVQWQQAGEITKFEEQDIVWWVDNATAQLWKPLIYVIPRPLVEARLVPVPANQRASIADEFTIPDLARSEFDLLEI
jgi:hypothetical protein